MERWVLAVGYDKDKFNDAQRECLNYGIFIRLISDTTEVLAELSKEHNYLLVAIFSHSTDYLPALYLIRGLTKAPVLILKHQYDGEEKIAAIVAGADEYIEWPDTIQESIASARALIRRYTELNRQDSCLRRIRRKLENVKAPCSIQNMRGVGYCFLQNDTSTVNKRLNPRG